MEPMTGYDLSGKSVPTPISRLRVHHDHGGIQDRERDRRQEGRRDNYIVKPFNAATLKTKIDAGFPTW